MSGLLTLSFLSQSRKAISCFEKEPRKARSVIVSNVMKRLRHQMSVNVQRVYLHVPRSRSLRNPGETKDEQGIKVDHSSARHQTIGSDHCSKKAFFLCKCEMAKSRRMDETYVKIKGQWN